MRVGQLGVGMVLISCVSLESPTPKPTASIRVSVSPSASATLLESAPSPMPSRNGKMFPKPNQAELPIYPSWSPPSDKWQLPQKTSHSLKIKVLDSRNQPLADVQVYEHDHPEFRSVTDQQGDAEVYFKTPQEELDLIARKPGYYPQRFIGTVNQAQHLWGQKQQIVFGAALCNESTFQANPLYTTTETDCCEDIDAWDWKQESTNILVNAYDEKNQLLDRPLFYGRINVKDFAFVFLNLLSKGNGNEGNLYKYITQRVILRHNLHIKAIQKGNVGSLSRIYVNSTKVGFDSSVLSFGTPVTPGYWHSFPNAPPLYSTVNTAVNPFALVDFYDLPITLTDEKNQPIQGTEIKLESQSCEYPFQKSIMLTTHQGVLSGLPVAVLLKLNVKVGNRLFNSQLLNSSTLNEPFFISQPKRGTFSPASLSLTLTSKGTVNISWIESNH